jgi:hypothetical protein
VQQYSNYTLIQQYPEIQKLSNLGEDGALGSKQAGVRKHSESWILPERKI